MRRFEDATLTEIDVEANWFDVGREAERRVAKSGALSLGARLNAFLQKPTERWPIIELVCELDRRQHQLGVRPAVLVTQIYRATADLIASTRDPPPPDLTIYWAALLLGWEKRFEAGPFPVIFDGLWRALRSGAAQPDAARELDGYWGAIAERVATTALDPVRGRDRACGDLIAAIMLHPALRNPAPGAPWVRRLRAILADPRRGSAATGLDAGGMASSPAAKQSLAQSSSERSRPPPPGLVGSGAERFDAFLGSEATVQALTARIVSGDTNRHVVFHGSAGSGKSTIAKLYARALRCEQVSPSGSACGTCDTCKITAVDSDFELRTIDLSRPTASAQRIADTFTSLDDSTRYSSTDARPRVIVVKHAEAVAPMTADRILKTMEKPRATVFIFTIADLGRLRFAIRSRCDVYAIKPLCASQSRARALELCGTMGLRYEPAALVVLAAVTGHRVGTLATHLARVAQGGDITLDRVRATLGLTWTDASLSLWEALLSPNHPDIEASFSGGSFDAPETLTRMQAIAHMLEVVASGAEPVAGAGIHPALLYLPHRALARILERLDACARRRGVDPAALRDEALRFWTACDAREPIGFASALRTFEEMLTG